MEYIILSVIFILGVILGYGISDYWRDEYLIWKKAYEQGCKDERSQWTFE